METKKLKKQIQKEEAEDLKQAEKEIEEMMRKEGKLEEYRKKK